MSGAIDRLKQALGPKGWVEDEADLEPYREERRGKYRGLTRFVARPATVGQVAEVVRICAEAGLPVVPQGGNTGLVGGTVTAESEIVLSTDRLDRIRDIDPLDNTITVEAGVILQRVQEAADDADRLFPLSLGAEGSCRIGGNLSSNAGGTGVLRYGNARDLTLGLEVVLPDGRVWNGLRRLRKDNTGYDLKQLFIGAEGTLGIITAAVLKLFPKPRQVETALVGLADPQSALRLLSNARSDSGDTVSAFELMGRTGVDFAVQHVHGVSDPMGDRYPWYVLIELASPIDDGRLRETMETMLGTALEREIIQDAVIAANRDQEQRLWRLREAVVEGQLSEGGSIKHDVSVPVSRVPDFIDQATRAVEAWLPGIRPCAFGHVGDGNIHFNLSQPVGMDRQAYLDRWDEASRIVHDIAAELDGSISAEHGIGIMKRDELPLRKDAVALDLMRRIKDCLDPEELMNPGKVLKARRQPSSDL
ncbi:FAD-binding oxidoreductase [Inquilinus sp. CAU 1745]|uniref:FAD-binding oxidoreductase n=1 Tax=Inquilinus sp. CAU 1745 TaxID=3140369 RepID=UPI00325B0F70